MGSRGSRGGKGRSSGRIQTDGGLGSSGSQGGGGGNPYRVSTGRGKGSSGSGGGKGWTTHRIQADGSRFRVLAPEMGDGEREPEPYPESTSGGRRGEEVRQVGSGESLSTADRLSNVQDRGKYTLLSGRTKVHKGVEIVEVSSEEESEGGKERLARARRRRGRRGRARGPGRKRRSGRRQRRERGRGTGRRERRARMSENQIFSFNPCAILWEESA
jgi:hypothetical protein